MLSSSAARLRDLEDAVYDVSFAFAFRAFHPPGPDPCPVAEKARAGFRIQRPSRGPTGIYSVDGGERARPVCALYCFR